MDILLPLFQLVYFVAHFLVSLALSVYDTFGDLHRVFLHLYSYLRPVEVSAYRLQADAALLKKIPEHIGLVIIGHHVNHVAQLVTVINWCVGYGVKYISLYDAHGILKQNKLNIVKAIEKSSTSVRFNIVTHNMDCYQTKDCVSLGANNNENVLLQPLVTVTLMSMEDGRGNLVTAARNLCNSSPTKVSQSMVDAHLLTYGQPDPQVVITVGEPMTTLGFLPWQIRLSEFFATSSLSRFEYNEFRTIFERYSRCEQRCGK